VDRLGDHLIDELIQLNTYVEVKVINPKFNFEVVYHEVEGQETRGQVEAQKRLARGRLGCRLENHSKVKCNRIPIFKGFHAIIYAEL
jgi:hypothetical protein